jgi:hydroxyacylglutathione hydrolase
MKVIHLEVGDLGTNCYIVYCEATKNAAVIDPGGNASDILQAIDEQKLTVRYIINTHGHADHMGDNAAIKKATGAQILIHEQDAGMLTNARHNLSAFRGDSIACVLPWRVVPPASQSAFIGDSIDCEPANRLLADGDFIDIGTTVRLQVLHTPGHTPGGISLLADGILFSGDTLFSESVGRTDLPGGSYEQLVRSIKGKLLGLDDEVKVLPGHGPATTIGWERRMNPFIQ